MKRTIGALAALALFLAAVAPVQAGGYRYGYGHRGYGHHGYGYRNHSYDGAYVALGIVGPRSRRNYKGRLLEIKGYFIGQDSPFTFIGKIDPSHRVIVLVSPALSFS